MGSEMCIRDRKKGCTESDNPEDYEATLNPAMYDYCRKCQKEPDDLVLRTTIITHATKYVKELCEAYDMTEHEETLQRRAEYVRQWKRANKARAAEKKDALPLEVFDSFLLHLEESSGDEVDDEEDDDAASFASGRSRASAASARSRLTAGQGSRASASSAAPSAFVLARDPDDPGRTLSLIHI